MERHPPRPLGSSAGGELAPKDCIRPDAIVRRKWSPCDPLCEFEATSANVSNVTFSGPSLDDCRRQDSAICCPTASRHSNLRTAKANVHALCAASAGSIRSRLASTCATRTAARAGDPTDEMTARPSAEFKPSGDGVEQDRACRSPLISDRVVARDWQALIGAECLKKIERPAARLGAELASRRQITGKAAADAWIDILPDPCTQQAFEFRVPLEPFLDRKTGDLLRIEL